MVDVKGLKIAWSSDLGFGVVDPEALSVAREAAELFEDMGCTLEDATPESGAPFEIFGTIVIVEDYVGSGVLLKSHPDELMGYVKSTIEAGSRATGADYARAMSKLWKFRARMEDFFEEYDLLLTPTTAVPAYPIGERPRDIMGQRVNKLWGATPFTASFNLSGNPAASVPCGFSSDGMPIGLQIVGRWGDEMSVLRASAALEGARPWADRVPEISPSRKLDGRRAMPGPLDGIRVVEMAVIHVGPPIGYILGDLGAEVIKVERPDGGDPTRSRGTFWFDAVNRSKKSVTLDLKQESGREALHRLIGKADIFVSNFPPALLERLGADYETLSGINSGLVYGQVGAWGPMGKDKDRRAFEALVQARSGFTSIVSGGLEAEPLLLEGGLFDQTTATVMTYGILAALVSRERTGRGQMVQGSLLGSAMHFQHGAVNYALWSSKIP